MKAVRVHCYLACLIVLFRFMNCFSITCSKMLHMLWTVWNEFLREKETVSLFCFCCNLSESKFNNLSIFSHIVFLYLFCVSVYDASGKHFVLTVTLWASTRLLLFINYSFCWGTYYFTGASVGCNSENCSYGGFCVDMKGNGIEECICDFSCNVKPNSEICASDGAVYNSTCYMDLMSCKQQKPIYVNGPLVTCVYAGTEVFFIILIGGFFANFIHCCCVGPRLSNLFSLYLYLKLLFLISVR